MITTQAFEAETEILAEAPRAPGAGMRFAIWEELKSQITRPDPYASLGYVCVAASAFLGTYLKN